MLCFALTESLQLSLPGLMGHCLPPALHQRPLQLSSVTPKCGKSAIDNDQPMPEVTAL